jgi:hypothetical protein
MKLVRMIAIVAASMSTPMLQADYSAHVMNATKSTMMIGTSNSGVHITNKKHTIAPGKTKTITWSGTSDRLDCVITVNNQRNQERISLPDSNDDSEVTKIALNKQGFPTAVLSATITNKTPSPIIIETSDPTKLARTYTIKKNTTEQISWYGYENPTIMITASGITIARPISETEKYYVKKDINGNPELFFSRSGRRVKQQAPQPTLFIRYH